MIKKNLIILIIFSFLNGCGFTPIFDSKNIDVNINKIDFDNNKISRNFAKSIETFSNQTSNNVYNLLIETSSTKNIAAKDSKGNPLVFNLMLTINITLINSKNLKEIKKSFSKNINFNNNDDKFKLRTTEETLISQMSQSILQEILSFLATIR